MRRSRIGLLLSAVVLVIVGSLPAVATAQPSPEPTPNGSSSTNGSPGANGDEHEGMLAGVLHGEGIVQTKKGPIRVAMQNGEATSLTQSSVTVRSSDGFTRNWALDKNLKVYDKRHTLQPNALKAGSDLVVAGPVTGATSSASPAAATYTAKIVLVHSS
jgi:hypothetical protein